MRCSRLPVLSLALAACGGKPVPAASPDPVDAAIARGTPIVEAFFGEPLGPYQVERFAHVADMAAYAKATWGVPELPCWAVAMGSGSTLVVLAPEVWATEACDHADASDLDDVIAHELTHVFQGQHRPDDVEMNLIAEDAAWFSEGLAVLVSGQLDQRRDQAHGARPPGKLTEVWTGEARYAMAGALVELIDRKLGRAGTIALLPASTGAEILAAVGMTEAELLEALAAAL